MEGFIRGGQGELDMRQPGVLPVDLRGYSTKAQREAWAAKEEARNPSVIIRRDWESDEEFEARKKGRKLIPRTDASEGMDPEMALKELRRTIANINGLDPHHPQYDKLWKNWTSAANRYEEMLHLPVTQFQKGAEPVRGDSEIPKELQDRLNAYAKLTPKKRREFVSNEEDGALLRLVHDTEPIPEIQQLALERMTAQGVL